MSNYELSVEESIYVVEIGNAGGILSASLAKAGNVPFPASFDTMQVNFVTAVNSITDFAILLTMQNALDSFPQDLIPRVTAPSINGFTIKLNAPTDTANYSVNWMLVPRVNG